MTIEHPPPTFPRGFILTTAPGWRPDEFTPGPLLSNLFVSPDTVVSSAGSQDTRFAIVLGTCVPASSESSDPAEALLHSLGEGEDAFLRGLDDMVGRHAIIYGDGSSVKVVTDATGMRSVFYASSGGAVASHALLVERRLGGDIHKNDMPFRQGYPGNATPYSRTKLLTPNTYYDVSQNRVTRFWPRNLLKTRKAADVARESLTKASAALRHLAADRPVKVALTAGLDSRAMLAVALHSSIEFETYTYGQGQDTQLDRALAADLAAHVGVSHTGIDTKQPSLGLKSRLKDAHYAVHHQIAVEPLAHWMGDSRSAAVTANLLEIGRTFYQRQKRSGVEAPDTPDAMKALHYRATPPKSKDAINEWGRAKYDEESAKGFSEWALETDFSAATEYVDPFDLFYWEHRMSAWHGASMVERDFYAEPFIPFNARSIFEAMLGVPEEQRNTADVLYELIRSVDPRLLDLPVNPKEWPATT